MAVIQIIHHKPATGHGYAVPAFYPFTAPRVIPFTKYFCKNG